MLKKHTLLFFVLAAQWCFIQSKFLLLMGPSGVGKSTLIRHLKELDDRFQYVTPLTTRELRSGERDKIQVTLEEIQRLNELGKLLAINHIYGIYYATPKDLIDTALADNRFPVLDWPIEKLEIMEKYYGKRLYKVYLQPDDLEELKRRLLQDGRDKDGKRYEAGVKEIDNLVSGKYDYLCDLKLVNPKGRDREVAQIIYENFLKALEG